MVFAGLSWNGVTNPFSWDLIKQKWMLSTTQIMLRKDWLKMYPDNDYFTEDGAGQHTSKICQNFLQALFYCWFINKSKWQPKSPNLDYNFWNAVQECVYDGVKEPLQDIDQLKERIKRGGPQAIDMVAVRKVIEQFRPWLIFVVVNGGSAIK